MANAGTNKPTTHTLLFYGKAVLLLLLLSVSYMAHGQIRRKPLPALGNEDFSCVKRYNYSLEKRLKNYPFPIAHKVLAVMFIDSTAFIPQPEPNEAQQAPIVGAGHLPLESGRLKQKWITETHMLTPTELDTLTDILYNYDFAKDRGNIQSNCYSPHHALVFMAPDDRVLEYIEICFTCNGIETSSPQVVTGYFCEGKYTQLKTFFRQMGLLVQE